MSPPRSGRVRRARGLGGDARPQRGRAPRPDPRRPRPRAHAPGPARSRSSWWRTAPPTAPSSWPRACAPRPSRASGCSPSPMADYGEAMRAGILAAARRRRGRVRRRLLRRRPSSISSLPQLTRVGRSGHRGGVEAGARHPRHAAVAPAADHRRVRAWSCGVLFGLGVSDTHGMKAMRRETVEPIVRQCRFGTDLFDTEFVLRADRAGLAIAEVPVTVEERRPLAHADRPPRSPGTVFGLSGCASSSGATARTDGFARSRATHRYVGLPTAVGASDPGERGRRGRGRDHRGFGGDDPDLVVCFASPDFVGAMEDIAFALGNLLEPRVLLGMAGGRGRRGCPRGRGRSRRCRCSRRRCPTPR